MFTRSLLLLGVAGSALLLLPGDCADAGCRHVQVVQQQQLQAVVAYQANYAQPYLYSVGMPYQYAAIKEQIKAELRAEQQAQQQTTPAPQTLPLTAEVDRWQLVKANCQSCHVTNQAAKEHVDMTDLSTLSCEQKLACIAAMLDGRMPRGKQIDSQTFANILGEFSGAATAHSP